MEKLTLTPEQAEEVRFYSGSTHPELARKTAESIGLTLDEVERRSFANSEQYVRFEESVREKRVFLMQSQSPFNGLSVDQSIMEQCLMVQAASRNSAKQVIAIMPNLAYARQDRKALPHEAISAKFVVDMIELAGADLLVVVDAHTSQVQGFGNKPMTLVTAAPALQEAVSDWVGPKIKEYTMVSPDAGRTKQSEMWADHFDIEMAQIYKRRSRSDSSNITKVTLNGEVAGMGAIINEDIIDTGATIVRDAEELDRRGAKDIIVAATHAFLTKNAVRLILESPITKLIVSDTVPITEETRETLRDKLIEVSVADYLGITAFKMITGGSVDAMFGGFNHH